MTISVADALTRFSPSVRDDLAPLPAAEVEAFVSLCDLTLDLPEPLVVVHDGSVVLSWTERGFLASAFRREGAWTLVDGQSVTHASEMSSESVSDLLHQWWSFYETVLTTIEP